MSQVECWDKCNEWLDSAGNLKGYELEDAWQATWSERQKEIDQLCIALNKEIDRTIKAENTLSHLREQLREITAERDCLINSFSHTHVAGYPDIDVS